MRNRWTTAVTWTSQTLLQYISEWSIQSSIKHWSCLKYKIYKWLHISCNEKLKQPNRKFSTHCIFQMATMACATDRIHGLFCTIKITMNVQCKRATLCKQLSWNDSYRRDWRLCQCIPSNSNDVDDSPKMHCTTSNSRMQNAISRSFTAHSMNFFIFPRFYFPHNFVVVVVCW